MRYIFTLIFVTLFSVIFAPVRSLSELPEIRESQKKESLKLKKLRKACERGIKGKCKV